MQVYIEFKIAKLTLISFLYLCRENKNVMFNVIFFLRNKQAGIWLRLFPVGNNRNDRHFLYNPSVILFFICLLSERLTVLLQQTLKFLNNLKPL